MRLHSMIFCSFLFEILRIKEQRFCKFWWLHKKALDLWKWISLTPWVVKASSNMDWKQNHTFCFSKNFTRKYFWKMKNKLSYEENLGFWWSNRSYIFLTVAINHSYRSYRCFSYMARFGRGANRTPKPVVLARFAFLNFFLFKKSIFYFPRVNQLFFAFV